MRNSNQQTKPLNRTSHFKFPPSLSINQITQNLKTTLTKHQDLTCIPHPQININKLLVQQKGPKNSNLSSYCQTRQNFIDKSLFNFQPYQKQEIFKPSLYKQLSSHAVNKYKKLSQQNKPQSPYQKSISKTFHSLTNHKHPHFTITNLTSKRINKFQINIPKQIYKNPIHPNSLSLNTCHQRSICNQHSLSNNNQSINNQSINNSDYRYIKFDKVIPISTIDYSKYFKKVNTKSKQLFVTQYPNIKPKVKRVSKRKPQIFSNSSITSSQYNKENTKDIFKQKEQVGYPPQITEVSIEGETKFTQIKGTDQRKLKKQVTIIIKGQKENTTLQKLQNNSQYQTQFKLKNKNSQNIKENKWQSKKLKSYDSMRGSDFNSSYSRRLKKRTKSGQSSSLEQISSLILTISNIDQKILTQQKNNNFSHNKYYFNQGTDRMDYSEKNNKQMYTFPEPKNIYQLFQIRKQKKSPKHSKKKINKGIISIKCIKQSGKSLINEDKKVKFAKEQQKQNQQKLQQKHPKHPHSQQSSYSNSILSSQFSYIQKINQNSNQSFISNMESLYESSRRAKILGHIYNIPKEFHQEIYKYSDSFNLTTMNLLYTQKQLSFLDDIDHLNSGLQTHNSIKILLNIDHEIIQRIVETRREQSIKNGIWLYCHGVWRCFIVKFDIQIYHSILKALQQASLKYYHQQIQNLELEQLIMMISGLKTKKIDLKGKKRIDKIINDLTKGFVIQGISSKKQIYSIQDVKEVKGSTEKIIKIKQQQSTFWLKEEQFYENFNQIISIQYRKTVFWTSFRLPKSKCCERNLYKIFSNSVCIGTITINYQNSQTLKSQIQSFVSITIYQQEKKIQGKYLKMVSYSSNKKNHKISTTNLSLITLNDRKTNNEQKKICQKIVKNNNTSEYIDVTLKGCYYLLIDCSKVLNPVLSYEGTQKINIQFIQQISEQLGEGKQFQENWRNKVDKLYQSLISQRKTAMKKKSKF